MWNPSRFRACCTCTRKSLECRDSQLGQERPLASYPSQRLISRRRCGRRSLEYPRTRRGYGMVKTSQSSASANCAGVGLLYLAQSKSPLCTPPTVRMIE